MGLKTGRSDDSQLFTVRSSASTSSFDYSNKSNASLNLLKADFYAFSLFLRGNALKDLSLSTTRLLDPVNPVPNLKTQDNSARDEDNESHKSRLNLARLFGRLSFNRVLTYVNGANVSKHRFLECFRDSSLLSHTGEGYHHQFAEFENYVIKLFSIHPTLGSTDRGVFLEDDGSMIESCLNYVRFYESSMHLLSQKLHHYFYLALFLLIVLLRNLRRLLHHYKSNSTFFDFLLIMVEGICLCQNHLFKTFMADRRIYKRVKRTRNTELLSSEAVSSAESGAGFSFEKFEELLLSHNSRCTALKDEIYALCRSEEHLPVLSADKEPASNADDDTTCSGDEFAQEDTEFTAFYENINPILTSREEHFQSTLDYDKFELFQLPNLNVLLDCKIYKWICELSDLANLYSKMGNGPVLLENPFTKLVLDADNTVLPKLCRTPFTNLSALRIFRVKRAARKSMQKLKNLLSKKRRQRKLNEQRKAQKAKESELSNLVESKTDKRKNSQGKSDSPRSASRSKSQSTPNPKAKSKERSVSFKLDRGDSSLDSQGLRKKYERWNEDEVSLFVKAVNTHGNGRWRFIEKTYFLGKKNDRQLKDKWTNLLKFGRVKRVDSVATNGRVRTKWVLVC